MTPEELIRFESDIADEFNAGNIKAPVHLSGGNENQIIKYFEEHFRPGDWICTYWRSHYHCLLAGVPKDTLREAILAGHSITLCFPKYRVISSAIVGGILPIALGVAMGIAKSGGKEKVHCFLGDMTARTGMYHECSQYARGHSLPIRFIIEDNGKSVMTDTYKVWEPNPTNLPLNLISKTSTTTKLNHMRFHAFFYSYTLTWPHSGAGQKVDF